MIFMLLLTEDFGGMVVSHEMWNKLMFIVENKVTPRSIH